MGTMLRGLCEEWTTHPHGLVQGECSAVRRRDLLRTSAPRCNSQCSAGKEHEGRATPCEGRRSAPLQQSLMGIHVHHEYRSTAETVRTSCGE